MRVLALTTALLLAASMAQAAVGFTDNFSGTALDSRWTATNSLGYDVSGGALNAQIGNQWLTDPSTITTFTAAAPTGDYTATMKVTFVGVPYADGGRGAPRVGIGAFSDNLQSMAIMTYQYCADGDFWAPGNYGFSSRVGSVAGDWPFPLMTSAVGAGPVDMGSEAFYMQLTRVGSNLELSYSPDGTVYTPFWSGAYTGDDLTKVGMTFFASDGGSPVAHVDSFTVGAAPEPVTMALLAIGGLGLLRRKKA